MLEKIIPNKKKRVRGSSEIISFVEYKIQIVVITNKEKNGIKGRIASMKGRIFPVCFLYEL